MLYKVKVKGQTIFRNSAEEVAKICKCSASNVYTRLGRKGIKSDIINGVEVTIIETMREVKRFADNLVKDENGNYNHWIEYSDGTKESSVCDEIKSLWYKWVRSETSKERYIENGFVIYEF